mmetsp:Transcript_6107/g.23546  ORF Transcript_6107/g.23546 Transcript_6107/m.23546 type:complete len:94 (+) Transcript_6107:615-896(+)
MYGRAYGRLAGGRRRDPSGGRRRADRRATARRRFFFSSRRILAEGMLDARGRRAATTAGTGRGLGFAVRGTMHRRAVRDEDGASSDAAAKHST